MFYCFRQLTMAIGACACTMHSSYVDRMVPITTEGFRIQIAAL
jgi:hypothetical protein